MFNLAFSLCLLVIISFGIIAVFMHIRIKNSKLEQEELEKRIAESIEYIDANYERHSQFLEEAFLCGNHYFSHSEKESFEEDVKLIVSHYNTLKENNAEARLKKEALRFCDRITHIESIRRKHNQNFVERELNLRKDFFDTILDYPLDKQQRESIVKLEDNCLVVSGAGSGKTSTMIGKLLYLVNARQVAPSRILTITYTRKAADELTNRLSKTGLKCLTFHKMAMDIIAKVEGGTPSVANQGLFISVFYDLMQDQKFVDSIIRYLTDYKSLVKAEHDYTSSTEYYQDRKKYGVIALYPDMDSRMISTKSEEEKKICSYLTELGVSFRYEAPYEYDTKTLEYRQYRPDFTIYYKTDNGKEQKLYLEHFAINSSNQVPKWFSATERGDWYSANQKYLEGIEWKKQVHANHHTRLIYTKSADFHNGTIRNRLRFLLENAGVPIKEASSEELMGKIIERNKSIENALIQLSQSFINLVKANEKNIDDIKIIAQQKNSARDVFVIDNIMRPLWNHYHAMLHERGEVDFTDMIVKATKYCNEGKWNNKYEYVLVDEFQDISIDRYHFLLSLRSNLPKTKIFCVGDDWQSIYRFSGGDLSLFSYFKDFFGYTEECKIETTYRFKEPLISESSKFIQKNPLQRRKSIQSQNGLEDEKTLIQFVAYENNSDLKSQLETIIGDIPADKTIYIISRYSHDIHAINSSPNKNNSDKTILQLAGRNVNFMTIHSAKGLEADYVFVLNCNSGLYGFPSLVSDDPVLNYVLATPENYEYAEERRVFYVALTRAKTQTVVFYNKENPSPFVTEMYQPARINLEPCPLCGTGNKTLVYKGLTKQHVPYKVWECDNRAAHCTYFERVFENPTLTATSKFRKKN